MGILDIYFKCQSKVGKAVGYFCYQTLHLYYLLVLVVTYPFKITWNFIKAVSSALVETFVMYKLELEIKFKSISEIIEKALVAATIFSIHRYNEWRPYILRTLVRTFSALWILAAALLAKKYFPFPMFPGINMLEACLIFWLVRMD